MSAKQIVHCKCDEGEPSNPECPYHGGKMKHTPGPWIAFEKPEHIENTGGRIWFIDRDNGNGCISPLEIATVYESGGEPLEQRANARLIAVAPEMLDALQKLEAVWLEHGCRTSTVKCDICKIREALGSDKLIARATGGTP